jgi:hypothetical protein
MQCFFITLIHVHVCLEEQNLEVFENELAKEKVWALRNKKSHKICSDLK